MTQYTPKNNFFNQSYYVSAEVLVHYLNGFMPHGINFENNVIYTELLCEIRSLKFTRGYYVKFSVPLLYNVA